VLGDSIDNTAFQGFHFGVAATAATIVAELQAMRGELADMREALQRVASGSGGGLELLKGPGGAQRRILERSR
jgi:hypothetical protein